MKQLTSNMNNQLKIRDMCQSVLQLNPAVNNNNNNNNNKYYYLLQLGCYPVAVVILHVNKT